MSDISIRCEKCCNDKEISKEYFKELAKEDNDKLICETCKMLENDKNSNRKI